MPSIKHHVRYSGDHCHSTMTQSPSMSTVANILRQQISSWAPKAHCVPSEQNGRPEYTFKSSLSFDVVDPVLLNLQYHGRLKREQKFLRVAVTSTGLQRSLF